MTNPYSMNGYQGQMYPQQVYSPQGQSNSGGPSTVGMAALGGVAGGSVGYFKCRYPVGSDGQVSDTFTKEVFNKNLKKNTSTSSLNYFKQLQNVLKKIDKVKTPEKFKKLINENKEIIDAQCRGISTNSLLDGINATNLESSKMALKESLEAIMNFEFVKTKNAIRMGWNNESKKFVKTPEFKDEKLFNIIKNTKSSTQWKKALKYGGITAGIMGALTIGYKMFIASKYN